jgi:hypothetical protein
MTSSSTGLTIFPTLNSPTQVEYGDWGNDLSPIFQNDGDPQECWTIELIVDNGAASVDISFSTSNDPLAPGIGMVDCGGGVWCCTTNQAVPPATCDASWTPPTLCAGSSPIDLDTTTLGTGVFSGPGVNSGNGMFDPSGLSGTVSVTFTVGDPLFNCSVTQDIEIIDLTPPTLNDTTICSGGTVDLDATVTGGSGGSCDYTLVLDDSYGDGWNGGEVDIYINGVLFQLDATVASCGGFGNVPCQNIITLPVVDGDLITLYYTAGSWNSENTITMYDENMVLVNSINNPPNGWLGGGITVTCPAPTYTYSWSPAGGLSDPNIATPTANVGTTTTYAVTVTQSGGCSQTSNVTVTIDPCGLAAELKEFTGVCFENDVMLNWSTINELNNDYFIVEYSTTGSDFIEIGIVNGKGNSNSEQHYGFRHKDPLAIANYYRLKQVDIDGNVKTYSAISVRCDNNSIHAFLNNNEQLVITADAPILNVKVLDPTGRILYSGSETIIDVSNHSATIFFLEIETASFIARKKVLNAK